MDTQILRIGQLAILAVPGEFTTMSGRRLREAVAGAASEMGEQMKVVIAGLSNTYTHYVSTWEEYQKQRSVPTTHDTVMTWTLTGMRQPAPSMDHTLSVPTFSSTPTSHRSRDPHVSSLTCLITGHAAR